MMSNLCNQGLRMTSERLRQTSTVIGIFACDEGLDGLTKVTI